jgi:hypothetical protein
MAGRTQPPPRLRRGVKVWISGKGALAAAAATLPHGCSIRGALKVGLGVSHLVGGPSPPIAVEADADEDEGDGSQRVHGAPSATGSPSCSTDDARAVPPGYARNVLLAIRFQNSVTISGVGNWSFFTNHARVLICIARDPGARLRDLAATLDITERSAHGIVTDLVEAGYVVKDKDGRRNRYRVEAELPLPESISRERTIGDILGLLVGAGANRRPNQTTKEHHAR